MEKLVANWYNVRPVPEDYIYPPEKRPGNNIPLPKAHHIIPVIDLSEADKGDRNQTLVVQKILKAAQEFGFFQVVNHGVSENVMDETISVVREFFQMPDESKKHLYTQDFSSKCIYFTSCENYANEKVHMWRDFLQHQCHPLEKWQNFWPESPARYRDIVGACYVGIKNMASRILGLISEGLGLKSGYFEDKLSSCVVLTALHYPPCPDPSLTLGTCQHDDANLITFLLQDEVSGLQIFKDDQWIGVDPIPHAFVVNVGCLLQVISNDKLRSVKHRVVTNVSRFRSSAAFFVTASEGSVIEPAKGVVDELNPAVYRAFTPKEFYMKFFENDADTEATFNYFKA